MRASTSLPLLSFAWANAPAPEVYEVRAAPDEAVPGAALTVVELDARADEQATVAEILAEIPGLQVRSLGGMGAMSAVSLRGSSPSQVAVYLDGAPMSRGAFAMVDLSDFAIEGLERIEVWRGLPPPDRMGAGLGGVIDLVPRRATGAELRATGGSFGTRGAAARGGLRRDSWFLGASAATLGSEGDFAYLDDNGTRLDASDDGLVMRANNGFAQADGWLHLARDGDLRIRAAQNLFYKAQGVPGTLAAPPTEDASLATLRSLTRASVGRPGLLEGAAYAIVQRDHFRDPENEIGTGAQEQTGRSDAFGGELRVTIKAGPSVLVLVPQTHAERYRQREALGAPGAGDLDADRLVLGGAIFDVLSLGDRLLVEPAVRIDRYADSVDGGESPRATGRQAARLLVSRRAGARLRATPSLDLRASGGEYHRVPTFFEMFGDRGFVVGNPELAAETGLAADAGATWRAATWDARIEAGVHVAWVDQVVVLVQNSQNTLKPENLGEARIAGVELAASAAPLRRLRMSGSYAYLDPRNRSGPEAGKQLPGRARHEAYGRVEAGAWALGPLRASIFSDADFLAGMFLDSANLLPLPPRVFFGAGIKAQLSRLRALTITVEGKNLADSRIETVHIGPSDTEATLAIQDYARFPLPGRAIYATARWTF